MVVVYCVYYIIVTWMFPKLQGHQQFSIVVMWHTGRYQFWTVIGVTDPMQDTVLSMRHACILIGVTTP